MTPRPLSLPLHCLSSFNRLVPHRFHLVKVVHVLNYDTREVLTSLHQRHIAARIQFVDSFLPGLELRYLFCGRHKHPLLIMEKGKPQVCL